MPTSARSTFALETSWAPATDDQPLAYILKLTNHSKSSLAGFRLCVSGPGRVDPAASIDGGSLGTRHGSATLIMERE